MFNRAVAWMGLVACSGLQAQEIAIEAWWAATDANGVQRVYVECGTNYIDPREIVVRRGVPVEIAIRAGPDVADDELIFSPPGLTEIRSPVGRQPTTVRFTPQLHGNAALRCSARGARESGVTQARRQGLLHVVSL